MHKKLAIYLIALISNLGTVLISPVMADMALDFPTASAATMGMVVTLPAFTLIPATILASSVLVTRVERRDIICVAHILSLVGGVLPAFLNSLPLIMVLRGILGIGMGLLTPIGITYVSEYPENERASMIGNTQVINCILSAGLLLLVGPVSRVAGWRGVFLMYGVILIPFIIIMTGIPRTGKLGGGKEKEAAEKTKLGHSAVTTIVIFCITLVLSMTVEGAVVSSISFYLERYELGGAQLASIASAIGPAALAVGAALFSLMMKRFKNWTSVIFLALASVAMFIYSTHTVATVLIGYCLVILMNALYALFTSTIISIVVPIERVALIQSVTLIAMFLGQFIAPTFQAGLGKLLHTDGADAGVFVIMAIIYVVLTVINIPFKKKAAPESGAAAAS